MQELSQADFRCEMKQQIVPMIITWTRRIPQEEPEAENFLLYIMQGQDMLDSIKGKEFMGRIESLRGLFPTQSVVLMIYGLKDCFRKSTRDVSRFDIEMALVEAQILHNCNHRLLESPADLAATVIQFCKSIAEGPFKKGEIEKALTEDCYFSNNSKDNVKIQNGVGYSRLWQEHLIKFPHVTLEVAQAISTEYPMPHLLMDALQTSADPENLLTNIPVRRSGGPLATQRKVGQELSKKIHKLYTTENPEEIL
uniref:ERCC4 domain-containing protein n=1 Tax=Lutzomyia longipalpis TaxID=7200 RepID=A0A1B0C8C0_LUTLO